MNSCPRPSGISARSTPCQPDISFYGRATAFDEPPGHLLFSLAEIYGLRDGWRTKALRPFLHKMSEAEGS